MSPSNAPHMHALRWALEEAQVRREAHRLREEATLQKIFEEAGGSRDFLRPGETLRLRAQRQLYEDTERARNLARFREIPTIRAGSCAPSGRSTLQIRSG